LNSSKGCFIDIMNVLWKIINTKSSITRIGQEYMFCLLVARRWTTKTCDFWSSQ
jgi:hypothetical protein